MIRPALVLTGLLPAFAFAANSFDGTWRIRGDSMKSTGAPDVYVLANGSYRCGNCHPRLSIPADGSEHKVTGHAYFDSVAIRVVSPTSIELTETLEKKPAATILQAVSDDGHTLTQTFRDFSGPEPIAGSLIEQRVGPDAFPGTHAVSGSWRPQRLELPDVARTVRFAITADGLKKSWNGRSFDARFDDKQYPVSGDGGQTTVSLTRPAPNIIEEKDWREGRVWGYAVLTLSADGKSITVVDRNPLRQTFTSYALERQ